MDVNKILRENGIEPLEIESHLYVNIRLLIENVLTKNFNSLPGEHECIDEAQNAANNVWTVEYLNNIYKNGFISGTHFIKDKLTEFKKTVI